MATWPWAFALFGPPMVVAMLADRNFATRHVRVLATVCASIAAAAGLVPLALDAVVDAHVPWPWPGIPALGVDAITLTELSRWLVGLPAWLWLVTVAVTPRTRIDQRGLRRTALATAFSTLAFATTSPALLTVCWGASIVLFTDGLTQRAHARTRRVVQSYLWPTAVLLALGVLLSSSSDAAVQDSGLWLVIVCVLVRKGIFPFHAWIPEAFEHGRLGPVVLFCAPELGTYVAAMLVVPNASPLMLDVVVSASLVTAIYGAALAVVQSDARRACGYLFVSQSALVLAGLHASPSEAATGALVLWLASALAFTGLARIVLGLEARRGRLDLRRPHGGADQMPMLAASFLLLGLACTGFPGTLGFVGEELLINGVVRDSPVLGFLTVGASAFTGLAVLRMYFSLFCGARPRTLETRLLLGEAIVFTSLAAVLVVTGVAPGAVVRSRARALQDLRPPIGSRLPQAAPRSAPPPRSPTTMW